ncbi:hypothetical protein shim_02470 [Shimia sp. SK013]|nr:hypothetical protein shim_02470 [Shimia sp. SK013]
MLFLKTEKAALRVAFFCGVEGGRRQGSALALAYSATPR